jgi:glycerol-3-phosphate acyltransferase PlsY
MVPGGETLNLVVWTVIAFLLGSIPFSVMVGHLATGDDIRKFGDRNPGATNVLRASNWGWFTLAGLLDYLKGATPVGFAWFFAGIRGWEIILVALAPVLGHAFSPWLRFRGGKAVGVTFGIWTGLTLGAGPIMLGILMAVLFAVVTVSGWAVLLATLGLGGFVWSQREIYPTELLGVWLGNLALLGWKHRQDLRQPPGIRPWLLRLMGKQA